MLDYDVFPITTLKSPFDLDLAVLTPSVLDVFSHFRFVSICLCHVSFISLSLSLSLSLSFSLCFVYVVLALLRCAF